jgi:hypothetical protein
MQLVNKGDVVCSELTAWRMRCEIKNDQNKNCYSYFAKTAIENTLRAVLVIKANQIIINSCF